MLGKPERRGWERNDAREKGVGWRDGAIMAVKWSNPANDRARGVRGAGRNVVHASK